jgi:uncharacterized membrane protein YbhN (UPF0104 family)
MLSSISFLTNRKIVQLGKVLLSCALLYLLFRSISWDSLVGAIRQAEPIWFLFAFAAALGQIVISAWRWRLLLSALGVEPPPLTMLVHAYLVSGFFNNLAPANIAGDAVRVNSLFRKGCDGMVATGSVVLERLLNMVGLAALGIWAALDRPIPLVVGFSSWLLWGCVIALLCLAAICLWLWRRPPSWLVGRLSDVRGMLGAARSRPQALASASFVTMVLLVTMMFVTFGSLQAMSVHLPLSIHLAIYAIAGIALTIPLTIQGIGIREGIYVGLLGLVGVGSSQVLAALALNYVILLLLSLLGGLLFWLGPRVPGQ